MKQNVIKSEGPRLAWTEARIERLVVLWSAGLNASRIAAVLGNGFTRSAVAGKLLRLGLRQSQDIREQAQAEGARRRKRRGPPMIPAEPVAPQSCGVVPRLVELTELGGGACRWPYATEAGTRFCGRLAEAGGPYCPDHHGVAYFAVLPPLTLEGLQAPGPASSSPVRDLRSDR